jgi:3-hydroxyisobutyrate dehydrogenase
MGDRLAFLGLGIMGRPMAANLARAGFPVTAWNRTRERAERFAAEHDGVRVASTPVDAAAGADVVITMVVDAPDVEQVLFGTNGAAEGLREGSLVVDMSTIAPSASRAIAERLRRAGIGFLDAPVTGSRPKAEDATLTIMVGGEEPDFDRARPILEALGRLVVRVGPQGHGSMVKLINNTVAAVNALAVAEALVLGRAAGVDPAALRRVMSAGSGASAMLELKAEPMLRHDFDPLFKLDHMLKDVRHCLAEAAALGVDLPLASTTASRYAEAASEGLGNSDFAAVVAVVEGGPSGDAQAKRT